MAQVVVMTEKKPTEAEFDAYASSYKEHVDKALAFSGLKVDFFTKVKTNYIADIINKSFGGEVDLLDVGCGIGNYHDTLRSHARTLTGIDLSEASIGLARANHPDVIYKTFDGITIPFAPGGFDMAIAICVFHHVAPAQRLELAKEIRRVIRPGGIFAIFEHNPNNPLTMRVVNRCEFDRDAVLLRSGEAEQLMRDAGFDTVSSRFILSIPTWNKFSRMIDVAMGAARLGAQYFTVGRVARP
jgi:SAM-dependent methyltransferase